MANYAVIAVAAGALITAGIAAGGLSKLTAGKNPAFAKACSESLHEAADWTIKEGERMGKSVSFVQKAKVSLKIPMVCACTYDAVKAEAPENKLVTVAKLAGFQYKVMLMSRAKDADVRESARLAAKEQMERLMEREGMTLEDVGLLARNVDTALKSCFQKHLSRT